MTVFNGHEYSEELQDLIGLKCDHCGQYETSYRLLIVRYHVEFTRAVCTAGRPVSLGDLDLSGTSYANAFRAYNWGLIRPAVPDSTRGPWLPTQLGLDFIAGRRGIPIFVVYRSKTILRYEGPLIMEPQVPSGLRGLTSGTVYDFYQDMRRRNIPVPKHSVDPSVGP